MKAKAKLLQYMLDAEFDEVKIKEMLEAYSIYISFTNKEYHYNQTYLESYFSDFKYMKDTMNKRRGIMDSILLSIHKKDRAYDEARLRISINDTVIYSEGIFGIKTDFNINNLKGNSIFIEFYYMADQCKVRFLKTDMDKPTILKDIENATDDFLDLITKEHGKDV